MKLEAIEGIGDAWGAKLRGAGIKSTGALLDATATPDGRKMLAEQSGFAEATLLKWANHCDLMRIKGVGSQYADLLEAAGVDTVVELGNRNAENLFDTLTKSNNEVHRVKQLPPLGAVRNWVKQAKKMKRKIQY